MVKALKRIAVLTAILTIAVVTGFIGAPVIFGYTIGTLYVAAGIVGLQELISALGPKVDLNSQKGNKEEIRSSTASRQLLYGRVRLAGIMAYAGTHGTDNKFLNMIFILGDGEVDAFEKWFLNDEEVTLDGSGFVTSGQYANKVRIVGHVGTDTQAADTNMVSEMAQWTTAHQLKGLSYYVVRYEADTEVFTSGRPTVNAVVRGLSLYDPSKDSTVPGGAGLHRNNDPSTWEWSNNWALVMLDYLKRDPLGSRTPIDLVDLVTMIASRNISDEDVTLKAGGTQKRYTLDGIVHVIRRRNDVLDEMLAAGAGRLVYQSGAYFLYAGADTPATITLDEDDLQAPMEILTKKPRQSVFNRVIGQFIDAGNDLYQSNDYPASINAAAETEDGEVLEFTLDQPFLQNHIRAQRVAKILLTEHRLQVACTFPAKLKGWQLQAWSTVKINNARFGWIDKKFRVITWQRGSDSSVTVVLMEYEATNYAWDETVDERVQTAGDVPSLWDGLSAPVVTTLVITATTETASNGTKIPALNVTWDAPSKVAAATEVQYKRSAASNWLPINNLLDITTGEVLITGLLPDTDYDVRVRHRTQFQIFGAWNTSSNNTTLAAVTPTDNIIGLPEDPYNLWIDPLFDLTTSIWESISGQHSIVADPLGSPVYNNVVKMDGNSSNNGSGLISFPVKKGDILFADFDLLKASANAGADAGIFLRWKNKAGGTISFSVIVADEADMSSTAWTTFTLSSDAAPALAVSAELNTTNRSSHTSGSIYLANLRVLKNALEATKNTGALADKDTIVNADVDDNTIEAAKLKTDLGVDLDSVVPGVFNAFVDDTDTTLISILLSEQPLEKFSDWTPVFENDNHRITILLSTINIRAVFLSGDNSTGDLNLYRRTDGGTPVLIDVPSPFNLADTVGFFNLLLLSDFIDVAPAGATEYRIGVDVTGGNADVEFKDALINFEAIFGK